MAGEDEGDSLIRHGVRMAGLWTQEKEDASRGDAKIVEHAPERLAISAEKEARRQRFLMQAR